MAHERERGGVDRDEPAREQLRRTPSSGASSAQQQILSLHGAIGNQAVSKLMRFEDWTTPDSLSSKDFSAKDFSAKDFSSKELSSKAEGESPSAKAQKMPMLRRGSSGPLVAELQKYLGVAPGDGIFGKRTAKAVRDFQRAAVLPPDGVVGPDTWAFIHGGVVLGKPELFNVKLEPELAAGTSSKFDKFDKFDKI